MLLAIFFAFTQGSGDATSNCQRLFLLGIWFIYSQRSQKWRCCCQEIGFVVSHSVEKSYNFFGEIIHWVKALDLINHTNLVVLIAHFTIGTNINIIYCIYPSFVIFFCNSNSKFLRHNMLTFKMYVTVIFARYSPTFLVLIFSPYI